MCLAVCRCIRHCKCRASTPKFQWKQQCDMPECWNHITRHTPQNPISFYPRSSSLDLLARKSLGYNTNGTSVEW